MSQQYPNAYGQAPQYHYPPSNSPPPGWQSQPPSRSSWRDPRFNTTPTPDHQVPAVQYSPGAPYQPNQYAYQQPPPPPVVGSPVSPIQQTPTIPYYGHDTSAWGVKYSQAHRHDQEVEQRPPLPPRPTSGLAVNEQQSQVYVDTHLASLQHPQETYSSSQPSTAFPSQHPPSYQNVPQEFGITYSTTPPPPPPRPTENNSVNYGYGAYVDPVPPHDTTASGQNGTASQTLPYTTAPAAVSGPPPPPPPRPPKTPYQSIHPNVASTHTNDNYAGHYGGHYQQSQSSVQDYGAVGPQQSQSQSPPPIADYNLNAPWSDPVMPIDTPLVSPSEPPRIASPANNAVELTAVQTPQEHQQPIGPWGMGMQGQTSAAALDQPSQSIQESSIENKAATPADTMASEPGFGGISRTGTIDSVIQAWTRPIQPNQPVTQGTPWDDPGFAPALHQLSLLARNNDPYQDLSVESKASLERFVSMLRREASAESDDEKFEIFNAFTQKETRLRAVLYGKDTEHELGFKLRRPQISSPLAEPQNTAPIAITSTQSGSPSTTVETTKPESASMPHSNLDKPAALPPIETLGLPSSKIKSHDDTYVMVNTADDIQYSPGGRPIIQAHFTAHHPPVPVESNMISRKASASANGTSAIPIEKPSNRPASPSDQAPIVVSMESASQPTVTEITPEDRLSPSPAPPILKSNKPYKPFKYQASSGDLAALASSTAASTKSYTALRKANVDSGRIMAPATVIPPVPMNQSYPRLAPKQEQAEAFLGLLRQRSQRSNSSSIAPTPERTPSPAVQGLHEDLRVLRRTVPAILPPYSENPALSAIRKALDSIPDDFSFIHHAVLAWNRKNLEKKKILETEKRKRDEESENNIDKLFNDNEIGYADIATLEAEHRAVEAKIAADQDVQEVETFATDVLGLVSSTIQTQLNALAQVYSDAMTLVESQSVSGSEFVRGSSSKTALPQAMDTLLVIYSKMQIRHQKLLEGSLERSRRLRKAKVNVLRSDGKITESQELEISSLKAEQDMIIDAKEKDGDRANFLMDTFDQVVLRGLVQNQNYVDEIFLPLQTIATNWEKNAADYNYDTLREVLLSTQAVLEFVAADSVSILKFSSKADEILNNADYDVSVAKAYRNDASREEFHALEKEKTKEDGKIEADTANKTESMVNGSREVQSVVKDLLAKVETTPEHKGRLEKALERAKKRNASSGGPGTEP